MLVWVNGTHPQRETSRQLGLCWNQFKAGSLRVQYYPVQLSSHPQPASFSLSIRMIQRCRLTMESRKMGKEVLISVLPMSISLGLHVATPARCRNLHLPNSKTTSIVCLPELINRSTLGACFCSSGVPARLRTCKFTWKGSVVVQYAKAYRVETHQSESKSRKDAREDDKYSYECYVVPE